MAADGDKSLEQTSGARGPFSTLVARQEARPNQEKHRGLCAAGRALTAALALRTLGTGLTIRATTTYVGSEHRYLRGYRVRIVAVLKADGNIIKDEDDLAR
ncbi:MAG: hypothetical protein GX607_22985, partial [Myxococcales bacterium]|nr:hypothetical protein [Myxococcales bacterium]